MVLAICPRMLPAQSGVARSQGCAKIGGKISDSGPKKSIKSRIQRSSRPTKWCALASCRKPAKGVSHSRVDSVRVDAIRVAQLAPSGSCTARFECVATVAYDHLLLAAIGPAAVQMNCAASAAPTSDVPTPAVRIAAGQLLSASAASAPVASSAAVLATKPIA